MVRKGETKEKNQQTGCSGPALFFPLFQPFHWLWTRLFFHCLCWLDLIIHFVITPVLTLVVRLGPLALFLGLGLIKASQEKAHKWGSVSFCWPNPYAMD